MNKISLIPKLFLIVLVLAGSATAAITSEKFNAGVELVTCFAARATITDDRKKREFEGAFKCSEAHPYKLEKISAFFKSDTKTLDLVKEGETVKTSKSLEGLDEKAAIDFLTGSLFESTSGYKEFAAFAKKRRESGQFENFIQSFKQDLEKILSISPPDPPKNLPTPVGTTDPPTVENYWFTLLSNIGMFMLVLLVLLEAIIIAIWWQKFKDYPEWVRRMANKMDSLKTNYPPPTTSVRAGGTNATSGQIESLKTDIRLLHERIRVLENADLSNEQSKFDRERRPHPAGIVEERFRPSEERVEIFYMSSPKPDGSFDSQSALSAFKDGSSIYKFRKISQTTAEFQIDESGAAAGIALQYKDGTIDPVCNASNPYDSSMKRIITESVGIAELTGDRWVVKRKAQIKYEH